MSNDQRALTLANAFDDEDDVGSPAVRDIHALTPPRAPRGPWETGSHRSSSLSVASNATEGGGENFTSMSREFNALVLAGATIGGPPEYEPGSSNLGRIREEENFREENPLAIVPDTGTLDPVQSPRGGGGRHAPAAASAGHIGGEMSVHRVKKEEVESKIYAWQNAKVAKINNRFKREDAIINGWEGEQVQKATSWMKKVEVFFPFLMNICMGKNCFF